jgi:hypothetical protein
MNDDYLWDRSGEPDPEIQQLELVLGALSCQPRPLKLPVPVRLDHSKTLFPRIAIAAAVATMLVGGGSWLMFRKQNSSADPGSASNVPVVQKLETAPKNAAIPAKDQLVAHSGVISEEIENKQKRAAIGKSLLARNKQIRILRTRETALTARDRVEAQAAKEQLMLALRVASAKLSLAQKKTQVGYPGGLIRNQHKVG